jgi:hypothetical protein
MPRASRIVLLWIPLALLTVVAVIIGVALTRSVQTRIAQSVLQQFNAGIRGRIELTALHVRWNGEVEITGAKILDEHGQFVAGIDTLRATVAIAELPDHVTHVRLLTVVGLRSVIAVDSAGTANIATALAKRQPKSSPSSPSDWKVMIDEFAARGDQTEFRYDSVFTYQSERWLLSGKLHYEPRALEYSVTFDDPAHLSVDAAGAFGFADSAVSLTGSLGVLIDSAFAAAISAPLAASGPLTGYLQFATGTDSLRVRIELATPHLGSIRGQLTMPFPPQGLALTGSLDLDPLTPSALWSDSTELRLRGSLTFAKLAGADIMNGWRIGANFDSAVYGRYAMTQVTLTAESADSVILVAVQGGAAGGSINLNARLSGIEPTTADLSVSAVITQLRLHDLVTGIPDSVAPLSGTISCEIRDLTANSRTVSATADLTNLRYGFYQVDSLFAALHMPDANQIVLDTARAWVYGIPLQASARGALGDSVEWELNVPRFDLARLRPLTPRFPVLDTLHGELGAQLRGVVSLHPEDSLAVSVSGDVRGTAIAFGADSLHEFAARIQEYHVRTGRIRGVARLRGLAAANQRIDSVSALVDGSFGDLGLNLRVWARSDSLELTSDLRIQPGVDETRVTINSANALAFGATWETTGTTSLTIHGSSVDIDALHINSPFGSLLATGTIARPGTEDFAVELSGVRLARIATLLKREVPDAVMNIRAQFTGPDSNLTGDFELSLDTVIVRGNRVLDGVQLDASASRTSTNLDLLLTRDADTLAFGHAALPAILTFDGGVQMLDSLPMFGALELHQQSLSALNSMLPYGSTISGDVSGNFMILGSPAIPNWSGELLLVDGAYQDRRYGLDYRKIRIVLSVDRDTLRIEELTADADGSVSGSGIAVMSFPYPRYLSLALRFERLQAVNSRRVQAQLSGNAQVEGPLDSLHAVGDVRFLKSLYRITQGTTKQIETIDITSEIARLRGDTTAQPRSIVDRIYRPMSHAIHVDVPGNMWLRGGGLNVELAGELWLYKDRHEQAYVDGDIFVRKGTVEVLGREFRVPEDSGRVTFKGDVANPELAIRAFYRTPKGDDLSVKLTGTLTETQSALSGTTTAGDSMSAEEVLTALIGAFVPGTANGGSGLQEQIAAASLSQLSAVVGKIAGVDLLQYRAADNGSLTQGSLEVGSYVTDRLFVRVLQPIESVQAGQEVTVEYRLLDWLKLTAQQYGRDASEVKAVFQIDWR